MKIRKYIYMIIIIYIISIITSCWDSREFTDLAIVAGTAIDKHEDETKIIVTNQIILPTSSGTGEISEKETNQPYVNLSSEDENVYEAIQSTNFKTNRTLYFPHNEILIFSNEIAKEGIYDYMDIFIRNPESRTTTWLLISKGKASQILDIESKAEKIPSVYIKDMIESSEDLLVPTSNLSLHDFMHNLQNKTTASVLGLIEYNGSKANPVLLNGSAILKNDKLIGELNKMETRGFLWATKELNRGTLDLTCPCRAGHVVIEILESHPKIKPKMINNKITMDINVFVRGNIVEFTCLEEDITSQLFIDEIEKITEDVISKEIATAIEKTKEYDADIFKFGELLIKKYPEQKEAIESDWNTLYTNIKVKKNINAIILYSGQITSF